MNIFDKIRHAKQTAKESDLSRYYKFLATVNISDPKDDDHATLDTLLSRLGKTLVDAESDRAKVLDLLGTVEAVKATADAGKRLKKSYEAHQAALAERQRVHHEQLEKLSVVSRQYENDTAESEHHEKSKGKLARLKDADPILFESLVGELKI